MPVKDWSETANNNSTVGGVNIAEGAPYANMNDMGRAIMADARSEIAGLGANVAAAATPDISISGQVHTVTGATTITGWATAVTGLGRTVWYETATPHTNSASLVCPAGANFTSAKGDVLRWRSFGAGTWAVETTQLKSGAPVGSVGTSNIANDAVTYAKIQNVSAASRLLGRGSAGGAGDTEEISLGTGISMSATTLSATGKVAQVVRATNVTYQTCGTSLPVDDTVPQITEGDQVLTSGSFTPVNASSTLDIDVTLNVGASTTLNAGIALFVVGTSGALAATSQRVEGATAMSSVKLQFSVSAASLTARTYTVRLGPTAGGSAFLNGDGGGRQFGAVAVSAIRVTEILP